MQIAEQERQLREILDYSPAVVSVVDEEGRLLFHNWRLRELTGYSKEELELFDTKRFWNDLAHRERVVEQLRTRGLDGDGNRFFRHDHAPPKKLDHDPIPSSRIKV